MSSFMGIDVEKSFNEILQSQKKLLKGMEVMMNVDYSGSDATDKEIVYKEDKMTLYHYKPMVKSPCKVPTLIVYALVNKQYMMDIQQDKSVIKSLLKLGLDLYIIDWGYPTAEDRYLTMEDYIEGYINNVVDKICEINKVDKINLIGVCQGGTFSTIYSALHPDKIKNLITMVTPIEFDIEDGLLFKWGKYLNIDNIVDAHHGIVSGDFMNTGFLILKPFQLMIDKYVGLIENIDNPDIMGNFMRMEKWIFDSPGQAGETLRYFVKDLYQENKLVKGELMIGDKKVDLKKITMPLLNIYAEYDHLVPPSASKPLNKLVSSKDNESCSFPVGHIGMYVSSRSQREVAPKMAEWLLERSKN
ncbi:class III poly(R)-hydroxyalkanoic acid synthase subunit PhaC [Clostridium cochlearium]|uniref:class III poly(R)-hydroxyalkanoic acid synthase subunit PhaC n=1 Tax=Clostridium cochlearium TaxID=1494 RepID=UPI001EDF614A|nr:class III poly(R)-hydroxyalkanoic acid synthase subunit PhaC [Clostridium cochlearium]MBV1820466.1 class III poly(R)-hydroxyalkanoic acid synthase subunit PhaC [Bacteroidales bacterium MSK.15.36]MCG4570935.1 class III poly(R)-hydroxyalkanoic acid synthase subunit PhaC [Clostridium cochlearium]MCG4581058.1 class III poly(R)-hydroxyalkanoic acid synthase subunit PhaC [Clostridium cochlearium]